MRLRFERENMIRFDVAKGLISESLLVMVSLLDTESMYIVSAEIS